MFENAANLALGTLLCLGMVNQAAGGEFFVAPSGLPQGDGSRLQPWNFETALADNTKTQNVNHVVKPGDTIWLRGGTYGYGSNVYVCSLNGASNNPITVRQYPGERAIIDGGISTTTLGGWTTFWGFEITCSTARTNIYANRPAGLSLATLSHKAINLIVHDSGHPGIFGNPGEVYGCIVWGVGIYEYNNATYFPTNPWVRGSGLYLQNNGVQGVSVSDNISSRNFTAGMKAYAENIYASGFTFDGNIVFKNNGEGIENECLNNSISNVVVINNFTYRCSKTPMGYFSADVLAQHYNLVYSNNYEVGSPGGDAATLWLKRWRTLEVVHNTIVTTSQTNEWSAGSGVGYDMGGHFIELFPSTNAILDYTINNNAYYGGVEQSADWYSFTPIGGTNQYGMFYHTYQPFRYKYNAVAVPDGTNGLLSFAAWINSHGFDVNSTCTTNLPTANFVTLRTNKYERGRANLVVFNWESNNTVNVDISSLGLAQGQRFEVRDVQNYFGTPVLTAKYAAAHSTISIPLTMTNVTAVTGGVENNYAINPNIHTASLFNAFVVLPLAKSVFGKSPQH